jgi:hypothetical protein
MAANIFRREKRFGPSCEITLVSVIVFPWLTCLCQQSNQSVNLNLQQNQPYFSLGGHGYAPLG